MINRTQEDIMKNWNMSEIDTPLVSVKCMTYNQEKYIGQCIDGFLMQKTSFPFEILIHDDCSTDNTTDIVLAYAKKFPKIIKPILEDENQYSKHDGSHHKKIDAAIKGKYIALCEGDDYWIDENKLQMQVDFLEKNPEYGLTYTLARIFLQEKKRFSNQKAGRRFISYEDYFVNGNCFPTLTICFRKDLYEKYLCDIPEYDRHVWKMGDLPLGLWFSKNSKIKYFAKTTSVYRVLSESASHSTDINKIKVFNESSYEIREYFINKYGNRELLEQYKIGELLYRFWQDNDVDQFLQCYTQFKYKTLLLRLKKIICCNGLLYKKLYKK